MDDARGRLATEPWLQLRNEQQNTFLCLFVSKKQGEFLPTMEHILLGSALAGLVRYVAGQDGENIVMSEFDAVRVGTSLLLRA